VTLVFPTWLMALINEFGRPTTLPKKKEEEETKDLFTSDSVGILLLLFYFIFESFLINNVK
jgi:hypothetical protein